MARRELARRAGALLGLAMLLTAPLAAQATARDSVLGAIDALLGAMHARDSAAMRAVLVPGAAFLALDRVGPADSLVRRTTTDQFIGRMLSYPVPITERLRDPDVRLEDDVAQVWAWYDVRFGERFSHCGINMFHVVRTGAGWRIAAITWSRRRERCG